MQYPGLITGTGINHQTTLSRKYTYLDDNNERTVVVPEFKLGLHFDYTTGMPILPGSSVKGLLRDAFPIKNKRDRCEYEKEKCQYIAAALYLLSELEIKRKNEERIQIQDKLVKIYGKEKYQEKIKIIEADKEVIYKQESEKLEVKVTTNAISYEEFEIMIQTGLDAVVQTALDTEKSKLLENYFSSTQELRERYDNIKFKIEGDLKNQYEKKICKIVDEINTKEDIPKEYFEKAPLLALEIFEGKRDGKSLSVYDRDIFFDAIPNNGDNGGYLFNSDYITPHKSPLRDPEPICFMRIRPGVSFRFFFDLKDGIVSKELKLMLFKCILLEHGMGAKTNVGYGQFK